MLDDLCREGKILHYGVSVEKVEQAIKAIEYPNVQSVQIIFNLFRQRPADLFLELAQKARVGILARVDSTDRPYMVRDAADVGRDSWYTPRDIVRAPPAVAVVLRVLLM